MGRQNICKKPSPKLMAFKTSMINNEHVLNAQLGEDLTQPRLNLKQH